MAWSYWSKNKTLYILSAWYQEASFCRPIRTPWVILWIAHWLPRWIMWSVHTDCLNGSWGHYTLTVLMDHEVNTHCVPGWVMWWIAHLTVSMCHVVNTTLTVLMGHVVNTHWMAQWVMWSLHTDCVNGSWGQYTLTVLLCHVMNTHWLPRWVM